MADTIRTVQYYKMMASNKPGECDRVLGTLRESGVNLLAFSSFPRGRRAQIDFIPVDPAAFKAVAKRAKWKILGPKTCFVVQGEDRPGAVAEIAWKLAEAKINVTAIDAVCGGEGRYGALLWVKPQDVKRTAKVLGIG